MLVLPNGHVQAFEIDRGLADRARENLEPFEGIAVTNDDATALPMQSASLGYVSASVVALPAHQLEALLPGGRIILPWQANKRTGLPSLITRTPAGYEARH